MRVHCVGNIMGARCLPPPSRRVRLPKHTLPPPPHTRYMLSHSPHLGKRRAESHYIVAYGGQAAGHRAHRGPCAESLPCGPVAGPLIGEWCAVLRGGRVVSAALRAGEGSKRMSGEEQQTSGYHLQPAPTSHLMDVSVSHFPDVLVPTSPMCLAPHLQREHLD